MTGLSCLPRTTLSLLVVLLLTLTALTAADARAASHANVFVYHRFGDARYPSTNVSLESFRQHLEILRQENATVITLGELVGLLRDNKELPERCAVITVDDGYQSFVTGAMPLLREYGVRATLFVNTGSVGGQDYLDWDQLRELQEQGIEIGNHSATHDYLLDRLAGETDAVWRDRVTADLARAQAAFAAHLNATPVLFAYPYGEYSPGLAEIVKAAGFEGACGQQSGVVSAGGDLFALPRFPMGGPFADLLEFRQKLRMRPLPVTVLAPQTTVVSRDNPPLLRFQLDASQIAVESLRCFVPGQENAVVTKVAGSDVLYEVRAKQALTGRRSKYTLTASDRSGQTWYWFSYLWVFPRL